MHSGSFGCFTKLGAKRAEVVQKFVARSRVGIYHNERIRSTPLHHKLTFWRVSYYLGAFGTVWLPYETRCKTAELVQKFVPRSRIRIFCNERTRSTPLDPKLTFSCISYYLGKFGTIWLPYETRCKTGQTSAKVRATKSHRSFSQRTQPIHHIGPQTDVWCVLYYLGAFGTVWLPYETRCKMGRTRAEVRATKSRRTFTMNAPDPSHWTIY